MSQVDYKEMISLAREYFIEGDYKKAEPLLNQVILQNNRLPEVFQMLATIYYDQGKFNKAIKTFKRALEIDPGYTDASVGLSIILNDLGRYDEGKQIFEGAQKILNENRKKSDPFTEERLAQKHVELGDMYFQCDRFDEANEQYYRALKLSNRKTDVVMKIVEAFIKKPDTKNALRELRNVLRDFPNYIPARLKLGVVLYNSSQVADAVEQWEYVLNREPHNVEAKNYLRIAQEAGTTALT